MCEISNGAGPGSAPLASAIFKEENCNHGQKVAFLVWAYNLGPPVEQMYAFFKPQPQTMKDREKTETPSLLVGRPELRSSVKQLDLRVVVSSKDVKIRLKFCATVIFVI